MKSIQIRKIALLTGWSLVVMALAAGLAMGLVLNSLLIIEDAQELMQTIEANKGGFQLALLAWVIILITDILVAIGLHLYYRKSQAKASMFTAACRLIYSAILAVAVAKLFMVIPALNAGVATEVMSNLHAFESIWYYGLIIFGLHLIGLFFLVENKGWALKIIRVLILIAGIGYLTNIGALVNPDFHASYKATLDGIFMLPMVFGELGLALWLVIKGGRSH